MKHGGILKLYQYFVPSVVIVLSLTSARPFQLLAADSFSEIRIIHTSDVFSRLRSLHNLKTPKGIEISDVYDQNPYHSGGVSRLKTFIDLHKTENTIVVDSGNFISGSAFYQLDGGISNAKVMGALGYNVATLGFHDAIGGLEEIVSTIESANIATKFVAANKDLTPLTKKDIDRTNSALPEYIIVTTPNHIRVAFIGALNFDLQYVNIFKPGLITNPIEKVKEIANKIEAEKIADLIVVLSHNPMEGKYGNIELAKSTSAIDIVISGSNRLNMSVPMKFGTMLGHKTILVESGFGAMNAGVLSLKVGSQKKKYSVANYEVFPISDNIAEDPLIDSLVKESETGLLKKIKKSLGFEKIKTFFENADDPAGNVAGPGFDLFSYLGDASSQMSVRLNTESTVTTSRL